MTRFEAEAKSEELMSLKEDFEELLGRAREIMRGTGMTGRRAGAYWIAHIEGALDNRGSMTTLQDSIDELENEENWDASDVEGCESCPTCGCEPGEGYTEGCEACQTTQKTLS